MDEEKLVEALSLHSDLCLMQKLIVCIHRKIINPKITFSKRATQGLRKSSTLFSVVRAFKNSLYPVHVCLEDNPIFSSGICYQVRIQRGVKTMLEKDKPEETGSSAQSDH